MNTPDIPHLKSLDEFFPSPHENHILEDVQREILESQGLIDENLLRAQQNWSFLANRIVGSEE